MAFMFEESGALTIRNARSIGLALDMHVSSGSLRFEAARPSLFGLETHLARMHPGLDRFPPEVVVIDPARALRGPAGPSRSPASCSGAGPLCRGAPWAEAGS